MVSIYSVLGLSLCVPYVLSEQLLGVNPRDSNFFTRLKTHLHLYNYPLNTLSFNGVKLHQL